MAANCRHAAVALNQAILSYVQMDYLTTTEQPILQECRLLRSILSLVMEDYRSLRNEVYCQVLKTMEGSSDRWALVFFSPAASF